MWPNGHIYLSASVRETLGGSFRWEITDTGKIIIWPKGNLIAYEGNGACSDARLARRLNLSRRTKLPLIEKFDRWETA